MRAVIPPPNASNSAPLTPEVVDSRIADVEAIARWLDYAFALPGGFRYGFAGLLDLIPGLGDIVDAALSLYIVVRAVQLGVPRVTLARMTANVAIEALVGSVPLLGAVFDSAFKANRRNYQLLRAHITGQRHAVARDWFFLLVTCFLLAAGIALPLFLLVEFAKHV